VSILYSASGTNPHIVNHSSTTGGCTRNVFITIRSSRDILPIAVLNGVFITKYR